MYEIEKIKGNNLFSKVLENRKFNFKIKRVGERGLKYI
jgi:hypothetical protein